MFSTEDAFIKTVLYRFYRLSLRLVLVLLKLRVLFEKRARFGVCSTPTLKSDLLVEIEQVTNHAEVREFFLNAW